jgi:hypothetical protein
MVAFLLLLAGRASAAPACTWTDHKLDRKECASTASWIVVGTIVRVENGPLAMTKHGCIAHSRYSVRATTWEKGAKSTAKITFTYGTLSGKKGDTVRIYGRGSLQSPEILAIELL